MGNFSIRAQLNLVRIRAGAGSARLCYNINQHACPLGLGWVDLGHPKLAHARARIECRPGWIELQHPQVHMRAGSGRGSGWARFSAPTARAVTGGRPG